jgi:hypothetical protein
MCKYLQLNVIFNVYYFFLTQLLSSSFGFIYKSFIWDSGNIPCLQNGSLPKLNKEKLS